MKFLLDKDHLYLEHWSENINRLIEMEKPFHFAYNPNQRQFIEDDRRYKEKIAQMNNGTV